MSREGYDPRIIGPRAMRTPHGAAMIMRQLRNLAERRPTVIEHRTFANAMRLCDMLDSGTELRAEQLAEIEAVWLSFVCKQHLPSVVAFEHKRVLAG